MGWIDEKGEGGSREVSKENQTRQKHSPPPPPNYSFSCRDRWMDWARRIGTAFRVNLPRLETGMRLC